MVVSRSSCELASTAFLAEALLTISSGPYGQFQNGDVILKDLTRVGEYARLLASVGINGVIVNNVNANATLLAPVNIAGLGRIADAMRPWGINIGISLNFASPMTYGNLSTFDPLDSSVIKFWNDKTTEIYKSVPDFAGYLVKANSEGQPGEHDSGEKARSFPHTQ
jgi:alpha-glucuronidase